MINRRAWVMVAVLATTMGCGGGDDGVDDPQQGGIRGACFEDGTCNPTLSCVEGICLGGIHDAAVDAPPADTMIDALVCDTQFEPNETTATAHPLTFAGTTASVMNVMICPTGDQDVFSLTAAAANTTITATVTWTAITGGAQSGLLLLNGAGATLQMGVANGTNAKTVTQAGLAAATYYLQVVGNGTYSYKLDVTRTP